MPKVDPNTGEPMSDAPEQEDPELRGGKGPGDPGTMEGDGAAVPPTGDQPDVAVGDAPGPDGPR